MKKVLIEGWRFIPHSYACVGMWQALELLKKEDLLVYFNDYPYFNPTWQAGAVTISPAFDQLLKNIPSLENTETADIIYRTSFPLRLEPVTKTGVNKNKLLVFGTSESLQVTDDAISGGKSLKDSHQNSGATIITCSEWSKKGFLNSGAVSERLEVVHLGVDTNIFQPVSEKGKKDLRKSFSWDNYFVFLHIGAMSSNKGIKHLLKAFAIISEKFPFTLLCLKGSDKLYNSAKLLQDACAFLNPDEIQRITPRIKYNGQPLSIDKIVNLYQAADAYVSPYIAEGFNLPVLEAAACGLPVICTAGGPTDEFIDLGFAKKIKSQMSKYANGDIGLEPDTEHLVELMSDLIQTGYLEIMPLITVRSL